MKHIKAFISLTVIILALAGSARAEDITVLHYLSTADGKHPSGDVIIVNDNIYGMTYQGGNPSYPAGSGAIFRMGLDGGGYTVLHEFGATPIDGMGPHGNLTLSGGYFYGMTESGGDSIVPANHGTVFKMAVDGTGFSVIHTFDEANPNEGYSPMGNVVVSGTTLYGMTSLTGNSDRPGSIFKMSADGTQYSVIHQFDPATSGGEPYGSLLLNGSWLYGMAQYGGPGGAGTIFKVDTDGNNFTVLHPFAGAPSDGAAPYYGNLILSPSDNTLWGMTNYGGADDAGVIFKIGLDGNNYSVTYPFSTGAGMGNYPEGSLTLVGNTLYGMTAYGGTADMGTIFKIGLDGTGYSPLYSFTGPPNDGAWPEGSLTYYNGKLYGMTTRGGPNDWAGTIFSFPTEDFSAVYSVIDNNYTDMGLVLTADDIDTLGELYFAGKDGLNPLPVTIDGIQWEYFPDQIAGKNPGDSWEEGGVYYFYFGSGVKGEPLGGGADVPEPSTLLLLLPFLGFGLRKLRVK